MGFTRLVARWWGLGVVVALGGVAALDVTGQLALTYRWLHNHVSPEGWSALGTWATAVIALGAAAFAWFQIQEVRRTREEQAQPNVVLYMEANANDPQILEIVMRNFGATPAYDVKVDIEPPVKSTPNNLTGGDTAYVRIPQFPILAPGQEWRTVWDSAVTRKTYLDGLNRRLDAGKISREEFDKRNLSPVHEATVTYLDSRKRILTTPSIIDVNQRNGTMWLDTNTVHHLTKTLDERLKTQNEALIAIHRRLAEFGTEHEGIWVYGSSDILESELRESVEAAEKRDNHETSDDWDYILSGQQSGNPQRQIDPTDVTSVPIEDAAIGDRFVPTLDGDPQIFRAWRIGYNRRFEHPHFGVVHELFGPDGKLKPYFRARAGSTVHIVRDEA